MALKNRSAAAVRGCECLVELLKKGRLPRETVDTIKAAAVELSKELSSTASRVASVRLIGAILRQRNDEAAAAASSSSSSSGWHWSGGWEWWRCGRYVGAWGSRRWVPWVDEQQQQLLRQMD